MITNDQAIVEIDGRVYTIDAFRGIEGWKYLPRITKFIMPIIQSLGGSDNLADGATATVDESQAMASLADLLSGERADEVFKLVQELVKGINVDGSRIDFDREFSQRYDVLLKLTFEVLKLNYLESFQRLATTFSK